MMVRGKVPTMTLAAMGIAVALTGCGQQSTPASQAASAPTASSASEEPSAPTSTTEPPETSATSEESTPAPSEEPSTSRPADQQPAQEPANGDCTAGQLQLSLAGGDGAAGTTYKQLWFKNVGGSECTIHGYPGVSYVGGDDGHQIGAAAYRDGQKTAPVLLAPGQSAYADVGFVNIGNYDPAECNPEETRGLRVYPPHDTASEFVEFPNTGCANGQLPGNQLTVKSVQKG